MRKIPIVAGLLSLALLTSCGGTKTTQEESKGNGEKIQIAVCGPMTGDNSEYGIGFYNAAVLKAKEWNDNGGVLGQQVEIVQYDDKNTAEEAPTIAQKIISDKKVVGVICHFS